MLLVQNRLRYENSMTFERILGVFLFKTGMFQRIKIKLILLNLKDGAPGYHSKACSLKKCTLQHIYFVIKCLVLYFGIKKNSLSKIYENTPNNISIIYCVQPIICHMC